MQSVEAIFLQDPILSAASPVDLARLMGQTERRFLAEGAEIFRQDAPANELFFVVSGACSVVRNGKIFLDCAIGCIGAEAALGARAYHGTAVAIEDCEILAIPADTMRSLAERYPHIRTRLLAAAFGVPTPVDAPVNVPPSRAQVRQTVGWAVAILMPLLAYFGGTNAGLSHDACAFLAIMAATISMWLFSLAPDFVPPLFSIAAVILLDIEPPQIAFLGFTSEAFFMTFSVFGIGVLMEGSGLSYRLVLAVQRALPQTRFWGNFGLFLLGGLFTPIIPTPNGRASLMMPFLIEVLQMGRVGSRSPSATQLSASVFMGLSLFATIFLTGSPPNLIVFGMLDPQTQYEFSWFHWLAASSVFGAIVFVASLVLIQVFFPDAKALAINSITLSAQSKLLGPLRKPEWIAIFAVSALSLGIVTTSLHRIEVPWLALTILVVLLLVQAINRDDLNSRIDWSILLFLAAIIAWTPLLADLGLQRLISENLRWLTGYAANDLSLFIAILSGLIVVVRIALPHNAAVLLFAALLVPIAKESGLNQWFIAFIVLNMADTFLLSFQSSSYQQMRNALSSSGLLHALDERRFLALNGTLVLVRVGAIYASVPFWRWFGLL